MYFSFLFMGWFVCYGYVFVRCVGVGVLFMWGVGIRVLFVRGVCFRFFVDGSIGDGFCFMRNWGEVVLRSVLYYGMRWFVFNERE